MRTFPRPILKFLNSLALDGLAKDKFIGVRPVIPTTVELTPGPAANTAGVQVTHLLSGGPLWDVSFHAAIVC